MFQQGQARDVEIFQNLVSLLETYHNPVAEVLWGEFIEWNELDRFFARSVLHSGRLQAIEDVVGTNHVWLDAHAALRRWYSEQGVSERDQLRVALFSQRFCRNYRYQHDGGVAPTQGTGRELLVATRSVEQLVDALRPPRDRKDTLARLLWLLELGLPMPVFQARARALMPKGMLAPG